MTDDDQNDDLVHERDELLISLARINALLYWIGVDDCSRYKGSYKGLMAKTIPLRLMSEDQDAL